MLLLHEPSVREILSFLERQRVAPFSYAEVGASRGLDGARGAPAGYVVDYNGTRLGLGKETFARAAAAIRSWRMFDVGWLRLCEPDAPIEAGATVAVLVRLGTIRWLNACRIVYVIDESAPVARFGFAYGTLSDHAERGEERFTVEWRRDDDSVRYEILAFSLPRHPLARAGRPLARLLQKRFARDSLRAMARAVAG